MGFGVVYISVLVFSPIENDRLTNLPIMKKYPSPRNLGQPSLLKLKGFGYYLMGNDTETNIS
jgi:hypothetical protein